MSSLNLWLLRHGESSANAGIWQTDPNQSHLTLQGMEQARQTAASIPDKPDLIVVSPLKRAKQSAEPLLTRWPDVALAVWPIQELVCLSPQKMSLYSPDERIECINNYWLRAEPDYRDGEDAESFRQFLDRVRAFYQALQYQSGFVLAVGHGQFFKAFLFALTQGLEATPEWMRAFRQEEKQHPINNSEIYRLKLTTEQLAIVTKQG